MPTNSGIRPSCRAAADITKLKLTTFLLDLCAHCAWLLIFQVICVPCGSPVVPCGSLCVHVGRGVMWVTDKVVHITVPAPPMVRLGGTTGHCSAYETESGTEQSTLLWSSGSSLEPCWSLQGRR